MSYREITLGNENFVHLLSGGFDSSYCLLQEIKKIKTGQRNAIIHPIFFDYGQFAADVEWMSAIGVVKFARNFFADSHVVDDPVKISIKSDLFQWSKSCAFKGNQGIEDPEIENRNMILFSILSSYLLGCAKKQNKNHVDFFVTSGFKNLEMPDASEEFFELTGKLLKLYKPNIKFDFKVIQLHDTKPIFENKEAEFKRFLELTSSCYSPNSMGDRCNHCLKCRRIDGKSNPRTNY